MTTSQAWWIVFKQIWYAAGVIAPFLSGAALVEILSDHDEPNDLVTASVVVLFLYGIAWQMYWAGEGWPK